MDRPLYTNAMTVSASDNKMEYVLTFRHRYPVLDGHGTFENEEDEPVTSVVMNRELLSFLKETLDKMLEK